MMLYDIQLKLFTNFACIFVNKRIYFQFVWIYYMLYMCIAVEL